MWLVIGWGGASKLWSVWKVWSVWRIRNICPITYFVVICSKCFWLYLKRDWRLFGTPIQVPKIWKSIKKYILIWLNSVCRVWQVWRVLKVSNPYTFSYILPICKKCIFFISQEGLYSLKGFKDFWPLSNYKHRNNLSKIRFCSYRGFGEFEEFQGFQGFWTPI